MNLATIKLKPAEFLAIILFLNAILYITLFFDIPIIRQVIGFTYITFIPGFVILKLLKLNEISRIETVLFSIGLSVAFTMLSGLVVNEILPLIGFYEPLSSMPLLVVQSGFVTIGALLLYLNKNSQSIVEGTVPRTLFNKFNILFLCLPILSIIGAKAVDVYQSNLLLLFLIVLIALLFSAVIIGRKLVTPNVYPFAVLMIALALLYHSSMISQHIVPFGSDVPAEYFVFKVTENNAHWSSSFPFGGDTGYGRLNAMLSINILPTVYTALLNIDSALVFKMVFPLIFSFVPLCLYKLWEPNIGKRGAFIAAFLFMSLSVFYTEMVGLARQMIAELFFILLLLVIFSKKIKPHIRLFLFTIFGFGLVISHYGLAEIFLFLFAVASIYLIITRRHSRTITVSMLVLFAVFMFFWYVYTSNASVFDSFIQFGDNVLRQLNQFLNPESRGETVLLGLGLTTPPTIWNLFGRIFAYLTQGLIVIGFVVLITRRTHRRFEAAQIIFFVTSIVLLASLIIVPGLANTLGMTRFYHILLFFLSPLFVLGAKFFAQFGSKRENMQKLIVAILLVSILTPYFLFQTGFVYELTGSQSYSLPLSKNGMSQIFLRWQFGYFGKSEITGALWLSQNVDTKSYTVYADAGSRLLLTYYVYSAYMTTLSNVTVLSEHSTVYLNRANLVDGVALSNYYWNTTTISPTLDLANQIYSNGDCEIYKNTLP